MTAMEIIALVLVGFLIGSGVHHLYIVLRNKSLARKDEDLYAIMDAIWPYEEQ